MLFGNLAIEAVLWFRTLKIYSHSNHNVKCYLQTTQLLWATMIKWKHLSDNKLKIFIDARCNDLFLLCVLHMFTCFVLFFPPQRLWGQMGSVWQTQRPLYLMIMLLRIKIDHRLQTLPSICKCPILLLKPQYTKFNSHSVNLV